jgi:hypothetical protein
MRCKVNFVHCVKAIMPRSLLLVSAACGPTSQESPSLTAPCTHKNLDTPCGWYIIYLHKVFEISEIRPMPDDPARRPKREALKRRGTLNPHPDVVTDPSFQTGDFFDPDDLVQVKYEMLRRVRVDKHPVSQSASAFGFSRPTYYQAKADFQRDGVMGLLPEKRGPRQGHKLTSEVLDFAAQLRASDPSVRPPALVAAIQKRFAITAHPRSIERALGRQEKKRR